MSKPVKKLMTDVYRRAFADYDGAVVVDISGVKSNNLNQMRAALAEKDIKVSVVKNTLARRAVEDTSMTGLDTLLQGPSTLVYGGASVVDVARQLVDLVKQVENLEFKGALMEGQTFAADQIKELSQYPTREEAQAQAVALVLSPGRNLAGQVTGPGAKVASIIKTIEEKLEKGEEIKAA